MCNSCHHNWCNLGSLSYGCYQINCISESVDGQWVPQWAPRCCPITNHVILELWRAYMIDNIRRLARRPQSVRRRAAAAADPQRWHTRRGAPRRYSIRHRRSFYFCLFFFSRISFLAPSPLT